MEKGLTLREALLFSFLLGLHAFEIGSLAGLFIALTIIK
jgi:hypothetical protein